MGRMRENGQNMRASIREDASSQQLMMPVARPPRRFPMKHRSLALPHPFLVITMLLTLVAPAAAYSAEWSVERTKDGHPDFQGVWANNAATPMERPKAFGDKARLSDEELAKLQERLAELREGLQAGDLLADQSKIDTVLEKR